MKAMAAPFIFIGTHRLKEGKLPDFEKAFSELVDAVEMNEPRMIAFNGYGNDDATEVAVVQVHPDVASMQSHMQVMRQHITHAYEELLGETASIQVFGELSDEARSMMQQLAGPDVPLSVKPRHLGGFTRSTAR
jgi:quinol monooxygenase YgiN